MPKFETVPAIKVVFGILEPKTDTKEEQEKLIDALLALKEGINKLVSEILPGLQVAWDVPAPATVIIPDRGKPEDPPVVPQEKPIGNGAGGYL